MTELNNSNTQPSASGPSEDDFVPHVRTPMPDAPQPRRAGASGSFVPPAPKLSGPVPPVPRPVVDEDDEYVPMARTPMVADPRPRPAGSKSMPPPPPRQTAAQLMPPPPPRQLSVQPSADEPSAKRHRVAGEVPTLVDQQRIKVTYFGYPIDPWFNRNVPVKTLDLGRSVNHEYTEFALRIRLQQGGRLEDKFAAIEGRYAKVVDVCDMPNISLTDARFTVLRFDKIGRCPVYLLKTPWHFVIMYEKKSEPIMLPIPPHFPTKPSQFRYYGEILSEPLDGGLRFCVTFEDLTPKRAEKLHLVAREKAISMPKFTVEKHKEAKAYLQKRRLRADDLTVCPTFNVTCKTLLKHVIFDALCLYAKEQNRDVEPPSDPHAKMNDQEEKLTHYVYRIMDRNKTTYDFWEKLMDYREAIKQFKRDVSTSCEGQYCGDHHCISMSLYTKKCLGINHDKFPLLKDSGFDDCPSFFLDIPKNLDNCWLTEKEYLQKLQGIYLFEKSTKKEITFFRGLPLCESGNDVKIIFNCETGTLVLPQLPRGGVPSSELGAAMLAWKLPFKGKVTLDLEGHSVEISLEYVKYFESDVMLSPDLWGPAEETWDDRENRVYIMHKSSFQGGLPGCLCSPPPCQCSFVVSMSNFLHSIFLHAVAEVLDKRTINHSEKQGYLEKIHTSLQKRFGSASVNSFQFTTSRKQDFEKMFDYFMVQFNVQLIDDRGPAAGAQ